MKDKKALMAPVKTGLRLVKIGLMVTALHASAVASETGTVRCDGGIISLGDTAGEVMSKCGQPAFATRREQKKVEEGHQGHEKTITTVTIDDWTFNFGPNQFQYRLLLEDGRVTTIDSLDYGY